MDGNDGTAAPAGVEPQQECECSSLKEEVRRLHAVKKYLEGRVEDAAQKIADLQKQVADADKKMEGFRSGNDELSKRMANLQKQNKLLMDDAMSTKEDLIQKFDNRRRTNQYRVAVVSNVLQEQRAETAEKKAEEADRRAFEAEQRAAKAFEAVSVAKRAEQESTTKAEEAVAEAVRRRTEAEGRTKQFGEQLIQSQAKLAEAEAAVANSLQSANDAAIRATVTDLVLEAELRQTKDAINETLVKLATAEKQAKEAKDHAAYLETKRAEAEQLAEEAVRNIEEAKETATDASRKVAEVNAEAERQRKMASEAKNRADDAEARAEGYEQDLQDARQQLAVQHQRADDAERRASEAELRLDGAKRQVADTERIAAIADRKALEFELKVKDAEKKADNDKCEVIDANRSAADAYRRIADAEKKVGEAREGQRQAEQRAFDAEAKAREQVAAAERHANEAIRNVTELENEKADLLRKIDALQRDLEREPRRSVQLRCVSGMDTMGSGIDPSGIPATPSANIGSSLADQPPSKKARYNAPGATREDSPFVPHEAALGSCEPSAGEPSSSRRSHEADVIKPGGSGVGGPSGGAHQITHESVDDMLIAQFRPVEVVVGGSTVNSEPSMTSQCSASSTGSTQLPRTYGKCVQYKRKRGRSRHRFSHEEDAALKKILVDNGFLSADGKPLDRFLSEISSLTFRTFFHAYHFKGKLRRRNEEALHARCIRLFSTLGPVQKPKE